MHFSHEIHENQTWENMHNAYIYRQRYICALEGDTRQTFYEKFILNNGGAAARNHVVYVTIINQRDRCVLGYLLF